MQSHSLKTTIMSGQDFHSRQWYHPNYQEDVRLPPGMTLEQTMLLMLSVSILGPALLIVMVELLMRCVRIKRAQQGDTDPETAEKVQHVREKTPGGCERSSIGMTEQPADSLVSQNIPTQVYELSTKTLTSTKPRSQQTTSAQNELIEQTTNMEKDKSATEYF